MDCSGSGIFALILLLLALLSSLTGTILNIILLFTSIKDPIPNSNHNLVSKHLKLLGTKVNIGLPESLGTYTLSGSCDCLDKYNFTDEYIDYENVTRPGKCPDFLVKEYECISSEDGPFLSEPIDKFFSDISFSDVSISTIMDLFTRPETKEDCLEICGYINSAKKRLCIYNNSLLNDCPLVAKDFSSNLPEDDSNFIVTEVGVEYDSSHPAEKSQIFEGGVADIYLTKYQFLVQNDLLDKVRQLLPDYPSDEELEKVPVYLKFRSLKNFELPFVFGQKDYFFISELEKGEWKKNLIFKESKIIYWLKLIIFIFEVFCSVVFLINFIKYQNKSKEISFIIIVTKFIYFILAVILFFFYYIKIDTYVLKNFYESNSYLFFIRINYTSFGLLVYNFLAQFFFRRFGPNYLAPYNERNSLDKEYEDMNNLEKLSKLS